MKTRLLIIIAILLVLFPLIPLVQHQIGNQVMADGMTLSGSIVLLTSFAFSAVSWFLLAWASKSIKVTGIPLGIISSTVLMIPFYDVLGPMTAVVIGIIAGFVAYMVQKYLRTGDNKSLIIAVGIAAATYLVLSVMLFLISPTPHIWNTGYGGGSVNWDPDLAPSYALDFASGLFYHTIVSRVGLVVGVSALFLVPFFILKRKNISSRPYMSLILAGLLLYFGISNLISSLHTFAIIFSSQPEQAIRWVFDFWFIGLMVPIIVLSIAGILLYRSSVIRGLIKNEN